MLPILTPLPIRRTGRPFIPSGDWAALIGQASCKKSWDFTTADQLGTTNQNGAVGYMAGTLNPEIDLTTGLFPGIGSLKFTVGAQSVANASGEWWGNYSNAAPWTDYRVNQNSTHWIVWGMKPDTNMVNVRFRQNHRSGEDQHYVVISMTSPAVFTRTAHGLANDKLIMLYTTKTLPTGFINGGLYYVRGVTANTFELSLTPGGASLPASGTQLGTHAITDTGMRDVTVTDGLFTATATHNIANGTGIVLKTMGSFPPNLTHDELYFVRDATATTFRVAALKGGAAITSSGSSTGVCGVYPSAAIGIKHLILGHQNGPNANGASTIAASSELMKVVATTWEGSIYNARATQLYRYFPAGVTHNLFESMAAGDQDFQNGLPSPTCTFNLSNANDLSGCHAWTAGQFDTYKMRVKLGPFNNAYDHNGTPRSVFDNSEVQIWIKRPGESYVLVVDWNPTVSGYRPLLATLTNIWDYGKIWLGPYMTNKDYTHVHPTAHMWLSGLAVFDGVTDPDPT